MENLTHTLFGLTLAKAGLERSTPLATTALVISSNYLDLIDLLFTVRGGTPAYLQDHRGFTHSFFGIVLCACGLTALLLFVDRRFRLRYDVFRRPVRALQLFGLSCLGGLGHVFMDFTNSYGVRPLLPFSKQWFYGDIAFVVDPWIWLILGSAMVWLTARGVWKSLFWLLVGVLTALILGFALQTPSPGFPFIVPDWARIIWFVGLGFILIGRVADVGRIGEKVARYALVALMFYYGGMWILRAEAVGQATQSLPAEGASKVMAWPTPANPLLWSAVTTANNQVYTRSVNILQSTGDWQERPMLEARFAQALRQSAEARTFLDFARYAVASVEEREDGFHIEVQDIRFNLRMTAWLTPELAVQSATVRWY